MKKVLSAIGLVAQLGIATVAMAQVSSSSSGAGDPPGFCGPTPADCVAPTAVPEPEMLILFGGAAVAMVALRRRKRPQD